MPDSFFQRVVVPVANHDDAATTADAVVPYVENSGATVIAVHVIEKAGGAPDKASVEQREQTAEEIFDTVADGFEGVAVTLETELRYGTDVAATIIDAAHEWTASTIVFTPRGGSRWRKLLSGDVTHKLVESSDVPVLVLPDREVSDA
ncbi:universal stress protein [Halobacterium bonnevillei]|uniref:Universal stress protein n=1 Tax=Halobacterium bonnevillei TaxID=2692200 RepID=A0A6B0SH24_9EURY|nr:universal stress protein [Halobacterium bonnevillei]MXR19211.1 universal stress protein [Halobacterium bonnevillei]